MRIKQGLEMGAFASAHKTTTKYRPQKHGVVSAMTSKISNPSFFFTCRTDITAEIIQQLCQGSKFPEQKYCYRT
jgi:hypothetical protein